MPERVPAKFYDTPEREEFAAAVEQIWGPRWRQPCIKALLVHEDTVDGWMSGRAKVPGPAIACLRLMIRTEAVRRRQRKAERDYKKRVRSAG